MDEETKTPEQQQQQEIINNLIFRRGALSWNIEQLSAELREVNRKLGEILNETKRKV
jgi:hypothetical protein